MPDSSIMVELCELLGISVNELLTGEKIGMKDYDKFAEENLLAMKQERENFVKKMLTLEVVMGVISLVAAFGFGIVSSTVAETQPITGTICMVFALVILFGTAFAALWIERIAGYYECAECGARYVPTYMAVFIAPHLGRTRYITCPHCGKRSWQKKVLTRE